MTTNNRFHSWKRLPCPECEAKALAPAVDRSRPEGYDTSRGYCHLCQRVIGAGPSYKSAVERIEVLDRLHRRTTHASRRNVNGLSRFLLERYGTDVDAHLRAWDIGTDDAGNTVYWYRNIDGDLRTAKVVGYNNQTGKRLKGSESPLRWKSADNGVAQADALFAVASGKVSADGTSSYEWMTTKRGYIRPLYGSQFLGSTALDVPVLLVEAEKTAVIASMFLRSFVLVASGGAGGLTIESASSLAGRDVFVMLDADDAGRRALDGVLDVLCKVGARPLSDVEGQPLVDYLMPNAPKGFDLADHYLSLSELRPDLSVNINDTTDKAVEVAPAQKPNMAEDGNCGIPQSSEVDEFDAIWSREDALEVMRHALPVLPNIENDVSAVRSMLLRVFGGDDILTDYEFYRRVWTRRVAGGSLLWMYGNIHKLTKPVHDSRSYVWSIRLLEIKP
jgi:hypothetical protein